MALTHGNASNSLFDPAPVAPATFVAALATLPRLHAEAGANLRLTVFLARSAPAALILMLAGMAAIVLTGMAGGGTLKADFAWAAMILLGVIAMTRNYIRGFARSLHRVPLQEAASDLRVLLLCSGAAWGSGAFLIMPLSPAPVLAVAFALLPSLAMALCLKDARGAAFFILPVTVATAGAALFAAWPQDIAIACAILVMGGALAGLPAVRQMTPNKSRAQPILH